MKSEQSKPVSAGGADKIKQLVWVFFKPIVLVVLAAISMLITQHYLMPV